MRLVIIFLASVPALTQGWCTGEFTCDIGHLYEQHQGVHLEAECEELCQVGYQHYDKLLLWLLHLCSLMVGVWPTHGGETPPWHTGVSAGYSHNVSRHHVCSVCLVSVSSRDTETPREDWLFRWRWLWWFRHYHTTTRHFCTSARHHSSWSQLSCYSRLWRILDLHSRDCFRGASSRWHSLHLYLWGDELCPLLWGRNLGCSTTPRLLLPCSWYRWWRTPLCSWPRGVWGGSRWHILYFLLWWTPCDGDTLSWRDMGQRW